MARGKPKEYNSIEDLTPRDRLFFTYYVGEANFIGTTAARLAGFKGTELSLRQYVSDKLRHPGIRALISSVLDEKAMAASEVLSELAKVARLPHDGDAKDVKNKVAALTTLAKYHGLLIERVQQTGEVVLKVQYGDDGAKPNPDNQTPETPQPAEPIPQQQG